MMYCYLFSISGQEENSLNFLIYFSQSQKEMYRQKYKVCLISWIKVEAQWWKLKILLSVYETARNYVDFLSWVLLEASHKPLQLASTVIQHRIWLHTTSNSIWQLHLASWFPRRHWRTCSTLDNQCAVQILMPQFRMSLLPWRPRSDLFLNTWFVA